MVVLAATEIVPGAAGATAVGETRPVDLTLYHDVAEVFFA